VKRLGSDGDRGLRTKKGFQMCVSSRLELEMTDLEALVVAAYVFADECPVAARGGRRPLVSDAELVALAVAQAAIGISSDRQFLGLIERVLPGWFPHLPEQSQYNRRLRGLVELISIVQQQLARWVDVGGVRLADGSQLAVANYAGCQQRSQFAGFARYGYARSQHRFVWGVRLVLLTDERGTPLGYTIVPANEKEYEPLADLLTGTPAEVVIADKGFWGRGYRERLAADGVTLLTPDKTRSAANLGRERALASTRLVIESVFANLKGQMRLEHHLAKTPAGLALRIAQRILALTIGILLNTLNGRPARALAAYDGR
jgi:IS5 family transposase